MYKSSRLKCVVPNYYALLDNNYWGQSSDSFLEIKNKYKEASPIFITDLRAKEIASKNGEAIYVYAKNYPSKSMRFDLKGNISATMNVVGTSILTALYMGFTEIYLLGCDYNLFCESTGAHCYDDADEISTLPTYNLAFYLKYYALTTEFHYLIASTARQMGVKIINISNKSLLDAYPRKKSIDYLQ